LWLWQQGLRGREGHRGGSCLIGCMTAKPLLRNKGGYRGDTVDVDDLLKRMRDAASRNGWSTHQMEVERSESIPWFHREADPESSKVYISAGVHGDEPAPLLAVLELLEKDAFPTDLGIWLIPCLNPDGFRLNTRENSAGVDINREYRNVSMVPVVRSHQELLNGFPRFTTALCLHEDWEALGFYFYEVNLDGIQSPVRSIIERLSEICPVDPSGEIDGRPAARGLIRPQIPKEQRPEWPEALYLVENKTRLSYTVESPSDFEMEVRVRLQVEAVKAFLGSDLFKRANDR